MKFAKAVLDGDRPSIPEVAIDVLKNLCNQMVALLRLRGPNGARDEFHLAAVAQNLRKLAKLVTAPT